MLYLKLLWQTAVLWGIYWLGSQIVFLLDLPLPGNVMGMVLLFCLLSLGIIKTDHIQEAVDLLLNHLSFFFIPISVGLMTWGALFYTSGVVLFIAILLSAIIALAVTGLSVQWLHKREVDKQ